MPQCEYPRCREREDLIELRNKNNGATYHYCEDHAPSGDNWEVNGGD